jgi:Na+:H+ antiporter
MNRLNTGEAKIILGAAVIDDILGLIILGVVSGLIESTEHGGAGISGISVLIIFLKAVGFLLAAIVIGNLISSKLFDFIHSLRVRGVLLLGAISFALIFAYLAGAVGLAPIVGAFAAGLVLANTNQFKLIEERVKPVADVFTPIFFIMVGAAVDVRVFNPFIKSNLDILMIAGVLFIVAVVGKFVTGWAVFQKGINRLAIGFGMIPRGEVGLIFAQVGLSYGVFNSQFFSAITVMVMLTTFVAPPLLKIAFANDANTT